MDRDEQLAAEVHAADLVVGGTGCKCGLDTSTTLPGSCNAHDRDDDSALDSARVAPTALVSRPPAPAPHARQTGYDNAANPAWVSVTEWKTPPQKVSQLVATAA